MIITVIIILGLVYLAFHVGAGHSRHRHEKAHGLNPHLYWSLARGPYGSVRLPGNFRLGHEL
jgi:hypothetical protein